MHLCCDSQNDLTGEHSCVMLKELNTDESPEQGQWLSAFWKGEVCRCYYHCCYYLNHILTHTHIYISDI